MKKLIFVLFCIILLTSMAYSQEFWQIQLSAPLGTGARAMGMGGAFIAVADDATAVTWNPGGLGQIEYIEISLVAADYSFTTDYAGIHLGDFRRSAYSEKGYGSRPEFFGISIPFRPFRDRDVKIVAQYGYQQITALQITADSSKAYFEQDIEINGSGFLAQGELFKQTEFIGAADAHTFSIASNPLPWLNVGITYVVMTNGFAGGQHITLDYKLTNIATDDVTFHTEQIMDEQVDFELRGETFYLGGLLKISDDFNVGIMARPHHTFFGYYQDELMEEIEHPGAYGLGIAFRPFDQLTLAADTTFTAWSDGKTNPTYTDEVMFFPIHMPFNEDAENEYEKQHDTYQLRLGAEYIYIAGEWLIPLRAGVFLDRQLFADANEQVPVYTGVTFGTGFIYKNIAFDLALVLETGSYKETIYSSDLSRYRFTKVYASLIYRF